MVFVIHMPIVISCLLECMVTYSLEEHKAVFLKRQNLFFFVVARSIWFIFSYRQIIFTSKIWSLLLLLWFEGMPAANLDIPNFNVSISIRRLTNNISCFKSNWLKTQNIKFSLTSRNYTVVFSEHYFMWHTQYITWEMFNF